MQVVHCSYRRHPPESTVGQNYTLAVISTYCAFRMSYICLRLLARTRHSKSYQCTKAELPDGWYYIVLNCIFRHLERD